MITAGVAFFELKLAAVEVVLALRCACTSSKATIAGSLDARKLLGGLGISQVASAVEGDVVGEGPVHVLGGPDVLEDVFHILSSRGRLWDTSQVLLAVDANAALVAHPLDPLVPEVGPWRDEVQVELAGLHELHVAALAGADVSLLLLGPGELVSVDAA